jgi:hypothetical protein
MSEGASARKSFPELCQKDRGCRERKTRAFSVLENGWYEAGPVFWEGGGIREKQQAVDELCILRDKNRGLPSTVGMSAEENWSCVSLFHDGNRLPQTVAVLCRAAGRRRAVRALGAERQIETQYGEAGRSEGFGHFDEQFRLAICAGAMREDDGAAVRLRGRVQEAANGKAGSKISERGKHKRPERRSTVPTRSGSSIDSLKLKGEKAKRRLARRGYPTPGCFL